MSLSDIVIGITIAFILYEVIGQLMPVKKEHNVPWSVPDSGLEEHKQTRGFAGIGKKFAFHAWFLKNERYRSRLDLLLIRSGHPFQWTVEDLFFFKAVFTGVSLILLWVYDVHSIFAWIVGVIIGFQFLDFYLKVKANARNGDIERRLPGFIDLLTLTIEGGLDLMAAVERIIEKMKPSSLREEMVMVSQEVRLGTPRKEALEHWVFRTNLPDVQSLTSMIIQSEELGTSLATVLRSYADDMRTRRIMRAEEIAGKAPVKLLFPMMVFFFPIVFVIIFGPLAMTVLSATAGK